MRINIIILILLHTSFMAFTQNLTGKWYWENDDYTGEVYFEGGKYLIKLYSKGTDIKITESFSYYTKSADTLIFSDRSNNNNEQESSYYLIEKHTDTELELFDIANSTTDKYANIDHKNYGLSKVTVDEFYFDGAIGCVSDDLNQQGYNNCLNFNSISILSSVAEIEQILGEPYSKVEQAGTNYIVYLIPSDLDSPPYLAISLNDQNNLETIQLTGNKVGDEFAFSGIRLGDYYTMVEKRIGKPTEIDQLDEQTELWSYEPHKISIELRNSLVYSIKLRRT